MFKVDLHTHSVASHDGGLRQVDFTNSLKSGKLDFIAITDHNRIDFALNLQRNIGEQIIVGEEIKTKQGEIIGLFLKSKVDPGLSLKETVNIIKSQGGVVYAPHPFETIRQGIKLDDLNSIKVFIDIVEIYNGRAIFQKFSKLAIDWANENSKAQAASSDAHGKIGWQKTYSSLNSKPDSLNIVKLLKAADLKSDKVGFTGMLYPKINKLKKFVRYD